MARSLRCSLALCAAGMLAVVVAAPASASAIGRPLGASLFATPSGIVSTGPWIVVTNRSSGTLTVLQASNGALVGRVAHGIVAVAWPSSIVAVTVHGHRVVFASGAGGRVSELALSANGSALAAHRLSMLRPYGCSTGSRGSLALDARGHLLEVCSNGVITEWDVANGALARSISAAATGLTDATGIAALGGDAAVTNSATASANSAPDGVTLVSLRTGQRLRTVTDATSASYGFSSPDAISSDGADFWVVNMKGNTVDELAGSTLQLLQTSSTNLSDPGAVLATRSFVWVSSSSSSWGSGSSMVTQFRVVDHALESPWMMCNTNGPYQFDNPSGFALRGSTLWVSNASDNLVDVMNASSGALVATYT